MDADLVVSGLDRPEALDDGSWYAILQTFHRLREAVHTDDRQLAVGSAKDLVESVARVVLASRGASAANNAKYVDVLNDAHRLIEYQPGADLARDAPVRQIAMQANKMAKQLRDLRNDYGTGHGRTSVPTVNDEVLETCIYGALLWTRWALRRLQHYLIGDLQALVRDLRSATFTRGKLAARLEATDLPHLDEPDQRRLGIAVGRRAADNTFVVWDDGVAACAASQDSVTWPPAYREGVIEGLLLTEEGHLTVDNGVKTPMTVAELLGPHPDQAKVLKDLKTRIELATPAIDFLRNWKQIKTQMQHVRKRYDDPGTRDAWEAIEDEMSRVAHDFGAPA